MTGGTKRRLTPSCASRSRPASAFVHLIETTFGLAREGHVNAKGMPHPLQLALTALEFSDIIVFRKPPAAGATPRVRRAGTDRETARLPRHLPQPLADHAGGTL